MPRRKGGGRPASRCRGNPTPDTGCTTHRVLAQEPVHEIERTSLGMFEGEATVQTPRRPMTGLGSQLGPLAGLCGTLFLLVVLGRTVGLGAGGWVVGLAAGLALNVALARALWRDPTARLGPAGWITLLRATLAVGVAALTAASFERSVAVATLVTLASIALALDFVDGWVARRTKTTGQARSRRDRRYPPESVAGRPEDLGSSGLRMSRQQ